MNTYTYFHLAAKRARAREDYREHLLGAVGVRVDGTLVVAVNGPEKISGPKTRAHETRVHAEARLCRKLDRGATVYVARYLRSTGGFANAKPCAGCMSLLKAKHVARVFYTTGPDSFEVLSLN